MRLDKYLKISRIIKRRTVAKEVCESGRVFINGRQAKPGTEVNIGDIIELRFGDRILQAEITGISEHAIKEQAKEMFRIIE